MYEYTENIFLERVFCTICPPRFIYDLTLDDDTRSVVEVFTGIGLTQISCFCLPSALAE